MVIAGMRDATVAHEGRSVMTADGWGNGARDLPAVIREARHLQNYEWGGVHSRLRCHLGQDFLFGPTLDELLQCDLRTPCCAEGRRDRQGHQRSLTQEDPGEWLLVTSIFP